MYKVLFSGMSNTTSRVVCVRLCFLHSELWQLYRQTLATVWPYIQFIEDKSYDNIDSIVAMNMYRSIYAQETACLIMVDEYCLLNSKCDIFGAYTSKYVTCNVNQIESCLSFFMCRNSFYNCEYL